jgi:hypothetical protein
LFEWARKYALEAFELEHKEGDKVAYSMSEAKDFMIRHKSWDKAATTYVNPWALPDLASVAIGSGYSDPHSESEVELYMRVYKYHWNARAFYSITGGGRSSTAKKAARQTMFRLHRALAQSPGTINSSSGLPKQAVHRKPGIAPPQAVAASSAKAPQAKPAAKSKGYHPPRHLRGPKPAVQGPPQQQSAVQPSMPQASIDAFGQVLHDIGALATSFAQNSTVHQTIVSDSDLPQSAAAFNNNFHRIAALTTSVSKAYNTIFKAAKAMPQTSDSTLLFIILRPELRLAILAFIISTSRKRYIDTQLLDNNRRLIISDSSRQAEEPATAIADILANNSLNLSSTLAPENTSLSYLLLSSPALPSLTR